MSTRSYLCMEQPNGQIKGIYCHCDGYLTYNGAMLVDHYNTKTLVKKLISLGNLSSLNRKLDPDPTRPHSFNYNERQDDVCVFYGRDRGEEAQDAHTVTLTQLADDPWIEYTYIFGLDNKWHYFEYGEYNDEEVNELPLVKDALKEIFKGFGIARPKDLYGFFNDEKVINAIKQEQQKNKGK